VNLADDQFLDLRLKWRREVARGEPTLDLVAPSGIIRAEGMYAATSLQ
jgi:hypothetical protein